MQIDGYLAQSIETPKRFREGLEAVCPTDPITFADVPIIEGRVNFRPDVSATSQQIASAQAFIAAFDWSKEATQAWIEAKEPAIKDIKDSAIQMVADIDAYIAIADTATAVQVRAEVKALDQRMKRLIKALARIAQQQS